MVTVVVTETTKFSIREVASFPVPAEFAADAVDAINASAREHMFAFER